MVKSPPNKSQKNLQPRFRIPLIYAKTHPIAAVLLAVFLVSAIYLAYHQYDLNKTHQVEKKQFAALETQMQHVMNEVSSDVGEPYEVINAKSCGYAALKFARGPLSCAVVYHFDYETNNLQQGKDITVQIMNAFKAAGLAGQLQGYTKEDIETGSNEGGELFFDHGDFSCTLAYKFRAKELFNTSFHTIANPFHNKIKTQYSTLFMYMCERGAVKPLYEVEHTNY